MLSVSAASLQMHPTIQYNKTISKCVYHHIIIKSYFAKLTFKCASCLINHNFPAKKEDTVLSFTVWMYRTRSYQPSYTPWSEISHMCFLFRFAHLICSTLRISLMWSSLFTGMRKLHFAVEYFIFTDLFKHYSEIVKTSILINTKHLCGLLWRQFPCFSFNFSNQACLKTHTNDGFINDTRALSSRDGSITSVTKAIVHDASFF